jgi:hypothetical protein
VANAILLCEVKNKSNQSADNHRIESSLDTTFTRVMYSIGSTKYKKFKDNNKHYSGRHNS